MMFVTCMMPRPCHRERRDFVLILLGNCICCWSLIDSSIVWETLATGNAPGENNAFEQGVYREDYLMWD